MSTTTGIRGSEAQITHETLVPEQVSAVIQGIERDIIRGHILPRTRLIEDHLMDDYGAKRHVVRAALAELQRLGVVVKPPHLGASIRRFDEQSLHDLYHVREVLHRAAIAITPAEIAIDRLEALAQALEAHAEAAESGDLIRIHRTNMAFHRLFYGLSDNLYLAESIRLHDWLSFPARAYAMADPEALKQACRDHAAMVAAVKSGDHEGLADLAVAHMGKARGIYEGKFLAR